MKTAMLTICSIGFLLAVYGFVDAIERHTEARLALAQSYREGCLPGPNETAIIVSNGRIARCRIYTTPSTSPGMAPRLISAATVEVTL